MSFRKIALIGNPNTGKTSVFNRLSGLNQKTGNFSGVTVEKKTAQINIGNETIELIDLPGIYSIYPHSKDEQVVYDILSDRNNKYFPDEIYYIADASNIERNFLLFSQLYDLNIPITLVINMSDIASRNGIQFNTDEFQKIFPDVNVIATNARVGLGIDRLKKSLSVRNNNIKNRPYFIENYQLISIDKKQNQKEDAVKRYKIIRDIISKFQNKINTNKEIDLSVKLDKVLTHKVFGYLIFAFILLSIFQAIFSLAAYPMEWIDSSFSMISEFISNHLPEGTLNNLITQGIIPGIGGIIIFVPQISILFFCLILLEETGYMSRVIFLMDRLMRPFGLNGRSVVPLMSSAACAIPGIMATRSISNWRERISTIFIAPFISCSARIPVYNLLILLIIPNKTVFGFINLQGLTLFALYVLGVLAALGSAFLLKFLIKTKEKSFLFLELPSYKTPRWQNVWIELYNKVRLFIVDAGKIILAISIILWVMASYGPKGRVEKAIKKYEYELTQKQITEKEYDYKIASVELENSYIGILGKTIEPIITPLGYDWKIGISLITSFAAREVFVGTIATIYSIEDDGEKNLPLIEKLRNEKKIDGTPIFSFATGVSLMLYYAFAMQCLATLAIVKTETISWKWPIIQVIIMGALAYLSAFLAYQILS